MARSRGVKMGSWKWMVGTGWCVAEARGVGGLALGGRGKVWGKEEGTIPSISNMETRAASSKDGVSDPEVRLPRPRQMHWVMGVLFEGRNCCERKRDRWLKHGDESQMGR